jgi:hypothetical protein
LPVASHVSTPLPAQRTAPGVQVPVHAPFTQACVVHATGVPHIPVASQVWTPLPEHSFMPNAHEPEHWPLMHARLAQATAADH